MTTKPLRRSQAQRRGDSQARILEAAIDLLIEKGFDRFSLHDVGKRAKCSHELVNFYFGNKDGLLNALSTHIIGNFSEQLHSFDVEPNGFERFAQKLRYVATIDARDARTFTAYMRMAGEAPFYDHLKELYRTRRSQTVDIFRQSILAGKALGDIRRGVDADEFAMICYDFIRGHVDRRVLDQDTGNHTDLNSTIDAFIDLLRSRIAVRKRGKEDCPDRADSKDQ